MKPQRCKLDHSNCVLYLTLVLIDCYMRFKHVKRGEAFKQLKIAILNLYFVKYLSHVHMNKK